MNRVVILMYHALYDSEAGRARIEPIDRPYALSVQQFERQMQLLRQHDVPVLSPRSLEPETDDAATAGVVVSFDDGHASNAELALPILQRSGLTAAFFLTTGFIGARPNYCSWAQADRLAQAGMLIGGHGHSHRFLSDLNVTEAGQELQHSWQAIHENLGLEPTQMSFPGGRCNMELVALGQRTGYRVFHGSSIGTLAPRAVNSKAILPRIAVKAAMSDADFVAFATARRSVLWPVQAVGGIKALVRGVLGNAGYHRLYAALKSDHDAN